VLQVFSLTSILQGGETFVANEYFPNWSWGYFVNAPEGERAGNLTQDGLHKEGLFQEAFLG
jgi:hypothetical protein